MLLTYQDVAMKVQVHPRTVQRWVKKLNLPVVRPTKCTVRLPAETIQVLIGQPTDYQTSLRRLEKTSGRPKLKLVVI